MLPSALKNTERVFSVILLLFPLCRRLRRNLSRRVHGSTKVATKVVTKGPSSLWALNTYNTERGCVVRVCLASFCSCSLFVAAFVVTLVGGCRIDKGCDEGCDQGVFVAVAAKHIQYGAR